MCDFVCYFLYKIVGLRWNTSSYFTINDQWIEANECLVKRGFPLSFIVSYQEIPFRVAIYIYGYLIIPISLANLNILWSSSSECDDWISPPFYFFIGLDPGVFLSREFVVKWGSCLCLHISGTLRSILGTGRVDLCCGQGGCGVGTARNMFMSTLLGPVGDITWHYATTVSAEG